MAEAAIMPNSALAAIADSPEVPDGGESLAGRVRTDDAAGGRDALPEKKKARYGRVSVWLKSVAASPVTGGDRVGAWAGEAGTAAAGAAGAGAGATGAVAADAPARAGAAGVEAGTASGALAGRP